MNMKMTFMKMVRAEGNQTLMSNCKIFGHVILKYLWDMEEGNIHSNKQVDRSESQHERSGMKTQHRACTGWFCVDLT